MRPINKNKNNVHFYIGPYEPLYIIRCTDTYCDLKLEHVTKTGWIVIM